MQPPLNISPENFPPYNFLKSTTLWFFGALLIIPICLFMMGVAAVGGYYLGLNHARIGGSGSFIKWSDSSLENPSAPQQDFFCTMDVKICPDGTAVGRSGPKCEFMPCPDSSKSSTDTSSSGQQEYVGSSFAYRFYYPDEWQIVPAIAENAELLVMLHQGKNAMEISAAPVPSEGLENFVKNRVAQYTQSSFTQNAQYEAQSKYQIGKLPTQEISYTSIDGMEYVELFAQVRQEYFVRVKTAVVQQHEMVLSSFSFDN